MSEPAPPPDDVWVSFVPGRKSPYKYYAKASAARGSIMLSVYSDAPRGGTVWHYKDGKWTLDRHFEPNNICVICEKPIVSIYDMVAASPRETKKTEMRYRHSKSRAVECAPPPQLKLEF